MAISHLVRRGVEVVANTVKDGHPGNQTPDIQIEYTYGLLIPALAAVEDSNPDLYVRVEADPTLKNSGDPAGLETAAAAPSPITSKLRTTVCHLRARAGRRSRFRGIGMFLLYTFAEGFLNSIIPLSRNFILGRFIANFAIAILLANLKVAWVHIVISEPSSKRFYQRIPSFRDLRKIVPAAIFEYLLTNGVAYAALVAIKCIHGLDDYDNVLRGTPSSPIAFRSAMNVISITAFVSWLTSIPARAIFIRVAASMLPEEDEAIVPFDRSFGGKVVPGVVGAGVLSISDAWKTFDWDGRKRYLKALFKAVTIEFSVAVFFGLIFTAEILGGALVCKPKN
ncbi:hypothetical protein ARAM_001756 [Aspergillus rambellii]|uniref:Uncharacterized protein n=1 Tax=Aspergillus rambellii TaxID=308745 RepID=A0A0F8UKR6_9EURO|nr:hypothetical protein ARAM_001756 [Aspergillus rambellii]